MFFRQLFLLFMIAALITSAVPYEASCETQIEFLNGLTLTSKHWSRTGKNFRVNLTLPWLMPESDERARKFNDSIVKFTKKTSSIFEEWPDDPAEPRRSACAKDYVKCDFEVVSATDQFISIVIHIDSYGWPAMHPLSETEVINYSLKNGAKIELADLFIPSSDYLTTISNYCLTQLRKKPNIIQVLNEEWIKDGTMPRFENFADWNIDKDGLIFTFGEYQVAAYAAGISKVIVPYSALAHIVRRDRRMPESGN